MLQTSIYHGLDQLNIPCEEVNSRAENVAW